MQALPLKRRLADGGALAVAQAAGAPPTRAAETGWQASLINSQRGVRLLGGPMSFVIFTRRNSKMTLERAAELISKLRETQNPTDLSPCDLFTHFVDFFNLKEKQLITFAQMCGFLIALNVEKLD